MTTYKLSIKYNYFQKRFPEKEKTDKTEMNAKLLPLVFGKSVF